MINVYVMNDYIQGSEKGTPNAYSFVERKKATFLSFRIWGLDYNARGKFESFSLIVFLFDQF